MQSMEQRYKNDIRFHTMVDMMEQQIAECLYTPSEIREAAVLASIHFEMNRTSRIVLFDLETEKALKVLRERATKEYN